LKRGLRILTEEVFVRYLNKQGNDGYYFEEWKKDINPSLAKKD